MTRDDVSAAATAVTGWSAGRLAERCWGRIRACPPGVILVLGFLVLVIYAFPGYMSTDSVDQLIEARTRHFSDAHPPIMAAQWAVLDSIVSGPFLMLVVQGGVFTIGLGALLRRVLAPRRAAVVAAAILVFPPVLTTMAVIWKDSQMAGYLLAGTACISGVRRRTRVLGVILIAVACGFRYNAVAAALPLVGLLFEWRPAARWWRRYAIAGLAFLAAASAAVGVSRALTVSPAPMPPVVGLTVHDVVGVLRYTRDRSDDDLREVLRGTPLRVERDIQVVARARYSPRNSYWLVHGEQAMFEISTNASERAALARAWRVLVLGDVGAYLQHRAAVSAELLGLSSEPLWSPVYNLFVAIPDQIHRIRHQAIPSYVQRVAGRRLEWLAEHTWLFRAYVYAVLALVLLPFALGCRDRLALAMLLSGLTYELSFFVAAGTPDFRYSHWMIICTCVAVVLVLVRRWRAGVTAGQRRRA